MERHSSEAATSAFLSCPLTWFSAHWKSARLEEAESERGGQNGNCQLFALISFCLNRLPAATSKDLEVWKRREEADRMLFWLKPALIHTLQGRTDLALPLEKHFQEDAYALKSMPGDWDVWRQSWIRCVFRSAQSWRPVLTVLPLSAVGLTCWWLIHVSNFQNLFLSFGVAHCPCLVGAVSRPTAVTWWRSALCWSQVTGVLQRLPPPLKWAGRASCRHIQIGLTAKWSQIATIPFLF